MVRNENDMRCSGAGLARHMPLAKAWNNGPEGALISDGSTRADKIAVVYNKGDMPPEITISIASSTVQTVLANGVAVAIVASADGPRLTVDDILLVERFVTTAERP